MITNIVLLNLLLIAQVKLSTAQIQIESKANNEKSSDLLTWNTSDSPLGKYSIASVAADNFYCSEIGRFSDTLLRGGNAVDAAIATLFCIGVMNPQSSGLGGGHFMTIYNASTKRCHAVDAHSVAPLAANKTMYDNQKELASIGWLAIAVPGELHGLWTEYHTFGGMLPWNQLLQPTIELLEKGTNTSTHLENALYNSSRVNNETMKEPTMHVFINNATNEPFRAGELITTRTQLLNTLRTLANSTDPINEFYINGRIANDILNEFKNNGAIITSDDLRNYSSIVRSGDEIIYTVLKNGRSICGPPPPSGSAIVQSILNTLDGYDFDTSSNDGNVDIYHRFIEASKFADAERSSLGDMAFNTDALAIAKNITSSAYANDIRSKITDNSTHTNASYYGGEFVSMHEHGTTHITVIDKDGNVVSVTSTINNYFGALRRSESTGIIWNNEMDDFSRPNDTDSDGYSESRNNYIEGGKRPQSSMSPIIIYDTNTKQNESSKILALGSAGGKRIVSAVAYTALHAMWLNLNVKDAVDRARLIQLLPGYTYYEDGFPSEYVTSLEERGHTMKITSNLTNRTVVTAVERSIDGFIYANSDYRKGFESITAGYYVPLNSTTRSCPCDATKVWLDIVLVIDTSNSMSQLGLTTLKGQLVSIFSGQDSGAVEVSTTKNLTRLGIVYFADQVFIHKNLTDITNTSDAQTAISSIPYNGGAGVNLEGALQAASEVFRSSDQRPNARNVILIYSSAYSLGAHNDPGPIAGQLKSEEVIIIAVAFVQSVTAPLPPLSNLTSTPAYSFNNRDNDTNIKLLRAFCDANCFCPPNWYQFIVNNGTINEKKYGECFYPSDAPTTWIAAEAACKSVPGINGNSTLPSVFDAIKNQFLFDVGVRTFQNPNQWIGLSNLQTNTSNYMWVRDNAPFDPSVYNKTDGPLDDAGQTKQCIAFVRTTGFNTAWRNFACNRFVETAFNSFCQINTCDTDNYCTL